MKAGTVPQKGFIGGSKVSTFTYDPFANCFNVTMYMATFSLKVGCLNQCNPNLEAFFIEDSSTGLTKEAKIYTGSDKPKHDKWHAVTCADAVIIEKNCTDDDRYTCKVYGSEGEFLCLPTSTVMLINYLGAEKTRSEYMLACIKTDNRKTSLKFPERHTATHSWQQPNAINAALVKPCILGIEYTPYNNVDISRALIEGVPIVQNISGRHVVLIIGGVFNRNDNMI